MQRGRRIALSTAVATAALGGAGAAATALPAAHQAPRTGAVATQVTRSTGEDPAAATLSRQEDVVRSEAAALRTQLADARRRHATIVLATARAATARAAAARAASARATAARWAAVRVVDLAPSAEVVAESAGPGQATVVAAPTQREPASWSAPLMVAAAPLPSRAAAGSLAPAAPATHTSTGASSAAPAQGSAPGGDDRPGDSGEGGDRG